MSLLRNNNYKANRMSIGSDNRQRENESRKGTEISITPNDKERTTQALVRDSQTPKETAKAGCCGEVASNNHDRKGGKGTSRLRRLLGGGCGGGMMWVMLGIVVLIFIINSFFK
jgi:hypothetical protein